MFTVINYGVGNLGSIVNMLNYLGVVHRVSDKPEDIGTAERLLLPGVGAFDFGMESLANSGLMQILNERVQEHGVPILGICLGMQIMCRSSEEGQKPGLGWFDADVKRFDVLKMDEVRPIPHMGWNGVQVINPHPILDGLPELVRFYFVHSYHVVCKQLTNEMLSTHYGYGFTAGIAYQNKVAVQFHPEKSHKYGLAMIANFSRWSYVPT